MTPSKPKGTQSKQPTSFTLWPIDKVLALLLPFLCRSRPQILLVECSSPLLACGRPVPVGTRSDKLLKCVICFRLSFTTGISVSDQVDIKAGGVLPLNFCVDKPSLGMEHLPICQGQGPRTFLFGFCVLFARKYGAHQTTDPLGGLPSRLCQPTPVVSAHDIL